jgi:hypothetical protein
MKETYTRAEVEALLKEQNDRNIQMIREHFEEERRNMTPPLWISGVMLTVLFGALWVIAVWG